MLVGGFPGGSVGKEYDYNAEDAGVEDPLEEGRAILSSTLAWRNPHPDESGGLQPIGSQSLTRLSTHVSRRSAEVGTVDKALNQGMLQGLVSRFLA